MKPNSKPTDSSMTSRALARLRYKRTLVVSLTQAPRVPLGLHSVFPNFVTFQAADNISTVGRWPGAL